MVILWLRNHHLKMPFQGKENLSRQEQIHRFLPWFSPQRDLPFIVRPWKICILTGKSLTKFRIMAGIVIAKKEKIGREFCSKWEGEPQARRRDLCMGEMECKVKDNFSADFGEIH